MLFLRRRGPVVVIPLNTLEQLLVYDIVKLVCLQLPGTQIASVQGAASVWQNSAPAHTAGRTMDFLTTSGVQVTPSYVQPRFNSMRFFTVKKKCGRKFDNEAVEKFWWLFFDLPLLNKTSFLNVLKFALGLGRAYLGKL